MAKLEEHLENVGRLTEKFTRLLETADLGFLIGKYHDIGKASRSWQNYLEGRTSNKPDHRIAGALKVQEETDLAVLPVLAHHGGLKSPSEVKSILYDGSSDKRVEEALELFKNDMTPGVKLPDFITADPSADNKRTCEFFIRMLFNALVDADYLDTEAFMNPAQTTQRAANHDIENLYGRLRNSQTNLNTYGKLNKTRSRIFSSVGA